MTTEGRGPLVGRERELGEATAALEGAAERTRAALDAGGRAGDRKDQPRRQHRRDGRRVADSRFSGGAAGSRAARRPTGPGWICSSELTGMLADGALRQALGDGAGLFGELVPEVRSRLPDLGAEAAPPPDEGRFRLWRATSALLNQAAKLQPLALVLDDLHAADRSSLALLHFVARQLRPMRIVLLGTYRDVEARMDAEASELLSRICREGATLPMARLDRGAAARFVRGRAGDVEAEVEARILDSAQGNPLFLNEMMNLRDEQGSAAIVAGEVPARGPRGHSTAARSVGGRRRARCWIWRRSPATSSICLCWSAASGRDAAWVSARLAEAARAGVVAATSVTSRRSGHAPPLRARAVSRGALSRARRGDPPRAARPDGRGAGTDVGAISAARRDRPPRAGRSRRHVAARGGPRAAGRRPRAGAAGVRRGDPHAGARARRGRRGRQPARCSCARVLLATGEARIRRGEVEAGKADCREAAAIARARDDAELAARAALTYGRVFTFGLVDPILVDMIETSLAALPPGDGPWRARLLARLGGALQPSLKAEEPVRVAREAIEIARRLGDKATLLETLHDGISALMDIVPAAEPRALNLEAERLAMELGRSRAAAAHARSPGAGAPGAGRRRGRRRAHRRLRGAGVGAEGALDGLAGRDAARHAGDDGGAVRGGRAAGRRGAAGGEGRRRSGRRHDLDHQPRGAAARRRAPRRARRLRAGRLPGARRASPGAVLAIAAIDRDPRPSRAGGSGAPADGAAARRARCRRSTTCSRRCSPPRPRRWSGRASSRRAVQALRARRRAARANARCSG